MWMVSQPEYIRCGTEYIIYGISLFRICVGIVVPGGFGNRGVEGKILAVKYARENKIPILGVCLGLQVMVIEFAR